MPATVTVAQIEAIAELHDKMGPALRRLMPQIEGTGRATKGTAGQFAGLDRQNALTGRSLGGLTSIAGRLAPALGVAGLAGGAASFTKAGINFNKTVETATIQFRSFFPTVELAEDHVRSLTQFAAATPFQMPGILAASRQLKVFGADAVYGADTLRIIGDGAAGVSAPLEDVSMWVGRMYTNLQAGRPIGEAAARLQELGLLSGPARAAMEDLAKEGGKSEEVMALLRSELEKHDGAMERLSKTTAGLESTFGDLVPQAAGLITKAVGLDDAYKDLLGTTNELLQATIDWMSETESIPDEIEELKGQIAAQEQAMIRSAAAAETWWGAIMGHGPAHIERITERIAEMNAELDAMVRKQEMQEFADAYFAAMNALIPVTETVTEEELERIKKVEQDKQLVRVKHIHKRREMIVDFYEESARLQREFARQELAEHNETLDRLGELDKQWREDLHEANERWLLEQFNLAETTWTMGQQIINDALEKLNEEKEEEARKTAAEWTRIWENAYQGIGGLLGALKQTALRSLKGLTDAVSSRLQNALGTKFGSMLGGLFTGGISTAINFGLNWVANKIGSWWKGEQKRVNDISDSLMASFSDIDEGVLTASEAWDKAVNWQGNEEGFERLRTTQKLWKSAGKSIEEATEWSARYNAAVSRKDTVTMRALLNERAEVARLARSRGERLENLNNELSTWKDIQSEIGRLPNTTRGYEEALRMAAGAGVQLSQAQQSFLDDFVDWEKVEEAAGRYGIKLDDLGDKYKNMKSIDLGQALADDFELLIGSGASAETVLRGMDEKLGTYFDNAMKYGLQIPSSMEPVISAMEKSGRLTKQEGDKLRTQMVPSMEEAMDGLISKVGDLVTKIQELIDKLKEVPEEVTTNVTTNYGSSGSYTPSSPFEGYRRGSGGIRDFGAGTPAMLHGREAVLTPTQIKQIIDASGASMGKDREVVINLDGQRVGKAIIPGLARALSRGNVVG